MNESWISLYILLEKKNFNINNNLVILLSYDKLLQTSFSHISIKSSKFPTVLMAPESPWKNLLINTSHVLKWSIVAKILGRSIGNHYGTVY